MTQRDLTKQRFLLLFRQRPAFFPGHVNELLRTDEYGNRMDWRKRETLMMSLDDLLDARINLVKTGRPFPEESETNEIQLP
jgi:hypothetical protein